MCEWYARRGDITTGPFLFEKLRLAAQTGALKATDLVKNPEGRWLQASKVSGLFAKPGSDSVDRDKQAPEVNAQKPAPRPSIALSKKFWICCAGVGAVLGVAVCVVVLKPVLWPGPKPIAESIPSHEPTEAIAKLTPPHENTESPRRPTQAAAAVPPAAGVVAQSPPPNADEVSGLLGLISLQYTLGRTWHDRGYQLQPYLPFLRSTSPDEREVAALAATWEVDAWLLAEADHLRVQAVPLPFGNSDEPKGAGGNAQVHNALNQAVRDGATSAYTRAAFWPAAAHTFDVTRRHGVSGMAETSANFYLAQLFVVRMQEILWDRAEELARNTSKGDNSRVNDVVVNGVFSNGRKWGTVTVTNQSPTVLSDVTVACFAPVKPSPKHPAGWDIFLGMAVGSASGDDDVASAFNTGRSLAFGSAAFDAYNDLPVRSFVHVAKLPAGMTLEFHFFANPLMFGRTHHAVYSLWAKGIAIERKPLPNYPGPH
jgi:hypothetical protein